MSSMQLTICHIGSTKYRPSLMPSPTDSTTTGRTTPLQEKLRQSISKLSAKAIYRRLICSEPGHIDSMIILSLQGQSIWTKEQINLLKAERE
jgi:hypothetical protein